MRVISSTSRSEEVAPARRIRILPVEVVRRMEAVVMVRVAVAVVVDVAAVVVQVRRSRLRLSFLRPRE